ncbi:MAG TPA: glutamate--tRNA ligase [Candidatus Limnocylindria bacterium]|nr:glutamate--tRNA ligase [Candidatus Limnocylindria bacterium]
MTVRVRFAPSPTGSLHIGSVRTTLYNWIFARQHGGTLMLRIEDTDQDRLVEGAIDSIYDGLRWMGLQWDEGPREGGRFAPYVQSERLPVYLEHARKLVESGAAYPCFCSKERLDQVRKAQAQRGEVTRYDGHCRSLDPKEAATRTGFERHVIRLKVPDEGTIALDDIVYGHIEWPLKSIDDQVLMKSDGFPTYHLAVVVDDHVMGITHVFRGEDWLPSTPKHLLIYRAFGWDVPPHGHFPNVLGPDSKKLAKRHGATRVEQFRTDGFLPEALLNYLALVGWSPGTEDEIFSLEQLVATWRIEHVQKAGGKWDLERLRWFNGMWIRRLGHEELAARLEPFLPDHWDRAVVRAAVPILQERLVTLADARDLLEFLFVVLVEPDAALLVPKKRTPEEVVAILSRTEVALRYLEPFEAGPIRSALEGVAADRGLSLRDTTIALYPAITGKRAGLPLFDGIALLGKERALARLREAQDRLAA